MSDYYNYNIVDYNKEFAALISEIESNSCSSIANIIRKLRHLENYNNADNNEVLSKFMRSLDDEIDLRNADIEKFCSTYYQNFVDSIKDLMKIQQEANDLKQSCSEVKKSLNDTVKKVTQDCSELSRCHSVLTNIDRAIEQLECCLPVFEQHLKAERCLNERRYYPALKALNTLELNQLQRVSQFAFSESMSAAVPGMRAKIKTASQDEIKDFLETVRRHSARLGWAAMRQTADKAGISVRSGDDVGPGVGRGLATSMTVTDNTVPDLGSGREVDEPGAIDREIEDLLSLEVSGRVLAIEDPCMSSPMSPMDGSGNGPAANIEDLVDFGPVYRCLHIHSVLGDRHEFEKCYRSQRRRQCTLLLTLTKQETIRNYSEFFSSIVGFFVVEDYIRYSEMSMVTRNYLDELWSQTWTRVGDFITVNSAHIAALETLLELKNYCVLFEKTMRSLGFNVAGFKDLYNTLRDNYQKLLAIEYQKKFEDIFEGEDYTAITVSCPSEMELVLELYPGFLSPEMDLQPYPKELSFSWMVPRIHALVRDHIRQSRRFSDNLELAQTALEDQLNHSTNRLFGKIVSGQLEAAVRRSQRQLNQLVQLAVNTDELETACHGLQGFILGLVGCTTSPVPAPSTSAADDQPRSRLHAFTFFKDLRIKIEDSIYNAIYTKIDDIFDDNDYAELNSPAQASSTANSPQKTQPSPTDSIGRASQASTFITVVIDYLSSTFESFTNLPPRLAQDVCFLCCKYINNKLFETIRTPASIQNGPQQQQPQRISHRMLQQMSVDVIALQQFTRRIPVAGISPDILVLLFEELRQLLQLVLLADWASYISQFHANNNPYDRVEPQNAINLLEKTRQSDTKFSAFLKTIKKNKQDKKDDEILQQLRDLR